ncbi:MAG: hypothetical protein LBF16_11165, partial [Pseudomonadales bacterium]|nr:hypothetical protein [Pseudomonadales bacterium]
TLAHGALGATAAQLTGKDATAGAIGGITESLLDNTLQSSDWQIKSDWGYTTLAMLVGGVIAEALGHDGTTAATAAQNAAVNNYLYAHELNELIDKQRACSNGDDIACQRAQELTMLNQIRNLALATACSSGGDAQQCTNLKIDAQRAMGSLRSGPFDDYLSVFGGGTGTFGDGEKQAAHALMRAQTDQALLLASGWTPEQIESATKWFVTLHGLASDMTAGGTVNDFLKAETQSDYFWAILGIAPGVKGLKDLNKGIDAVEAIKKAEKLAAKGGIGAAGEAANAGKLIGSMENLTAAEQSFVKEMVAGGKTVEIIPTAAGRTADFFIDGVKYELKTMSNVASQTSNGLSASLSRTITDARGQSGNIIIDARTQAGMTPEIAERGIIRAFGADADGKIQNITVITSQGTISIPRIP